MATTKGNDINELPRRTHAQAIGLKHVANGYAGWLVDGTSSTRWTRHWERRRNPSRREWRKR